MLEIILLISMVLQILAIVYALKLIKITGRRLAWGLIATAIALMAIRRGISLAEFLITGRAISGDIFIELVALTISILMVIGVARITPIFKDIRSIQGKLARSEEKYRTLVENAPLGIFRCTEAGKFLEVNPAMAKIVGFDTPETMVTQVRHIGEQFYVNPEQRKATYAELVKPNAGIVQSLVHARRLDGTDFFARMMITAVRDDDGQIKYFEGNVEDVTEQKVAEEEKEKFRTQLLQAQKMESIGTLAGGIAHDFNNMLGVIIAYSDIAMNREVGDTGLQSDLQEIRNAADRSTDLTRQLLTFASRQLTQPKVIDPNTAIEGMLKLLQRMIREDVVIECDLAEGAWPILIDPSQFDQILANMCVNSRDAIEYSGKITIETNNRTLDNEFCSRHANVEAGDYMCLSISDDGSGIDPKISMQIFDPFFTTKEKGKGTGLGLSTVFGIVQQGKGFIEVFSELGKGTAFSIYFPRQRDASIEESFEPKPETRKGGNESIMVVDDDDLVLNMVQSILEKAGYAVLPAKCPVEAIEIAREHAGEIHMLITDIIMPKMNGRDLAEGLLTEYPSLKCLYMSGYTGSIVNDISDLGQGSHFIQKPFTVASLTSTVRTVLDL